ncbi:MAG: hypothetical protein KAR80_08645 [Rhodospirillaceae bacterium]|nr:hypothetical protein [Rhodospirillaceae bacterium]
MNQFDERFISLEEIQIWHIRPLIGNVSSELWIDFFRSHSDRVNGEDLFVLIEDTGIHDDANHHLFKAFMDLLLSSGVNRVRVAVVSEDEGLNLMTKLLEDAGKSKGIDADARIFPLVDAAKSWLLNSSRSKITNRTN